MPTIPENIKNRYLMASSGLTSGLPAGSIPVARIDGTMSQDVVFLGRPGNVGIPDGSTISGISGMTCWVKGDALVLNDGDLVTTWADQSGNSNDFSSSGATRPTYSAAGINGVPAISFNGSSTYFPTGPSSSALLSTSAHTTFIVFKANSGGSGSISSGNAFNAVGLIFAPSFASYGITLSNDPKIWATAYDGTHRAVGQTISYAAVYRMTYYHDGSNIFANLNGGTYSSVTMGSTPFGSNLVMGHGAGGYFNGMIAEYITFNRQLSGPEIATVDAYLALKYAQALNAPSLALSNGYGFDGQGNITASTITGTNITASTGLTATSGGITVTAGDITATSSAIFCASLTSTGAVSGSTFTGSGSGLSSLNASNLTSGTVPLARLSGITTTQLSGSAGILGSQIASATIAGSNVASATITGSNIVSATVTGSNIASATVTGSNIASATITGSNIASTTIDSGKLTNVVSSGTYNSVTVDTAGRVVAGTVAIGGTVSATVVKPLDTDFTSTGVISQLSLSIGASEAWYFKYVIFATVNGGTGNNIQISFDQAVAGWRFNASVLDTNGTATYAIDVASHACSVTVGHVATVIFEGYLANSSTAGTLTVSQNNTSCTIAAQSTLFACKQ